MTGVIDYDRPFAETVIEGECFRPRGDDDWCVIGTDHELCYVEIWRQQMQDRMRSHNTFAVCDVPVCQSFVAKAASWTDMIAKVPAEVTYARMPLCPTSSITAESSCSVASLFCQHRLYTLHRPFSLTSCLGWSRCSDVRLRLRQRRISLSSTMPPQASGGHRPSCLRTLLIT